jgi:hypothetical protein
VAAEAAIQAAARLIHGGLILVVLAGNFPKTRGDPGVIDPIKTTRSSNSFDTFRRPAAYVGSVVDLSNPMVLQSLEHCCCSIPKEIRNADILVPFQGLDWQMQLQRSESERFGFFAS